jgi:hypothetical protein
MLAVPIAGQAPCAGPEHLTAPHMVSAFDLPVEIFIDRHGVDLPVEVVGEFLGCGAWPVFRWLP